MSLDMSLLRQYREENWVPYNMVAQDFPEMFQSRYHDLLDQAYDEVVRSIRILPALFRLRYDIPKIPPPFYEPPVQDTYYAFDLNAMFPLSDPEQAGYEIKMKSLAFVESDNVTKGENLTSQEVLGFQMDWDNESPVTDKPVYLDDNILSYIVREGDEYKSVLLVVHPYPVFISTMIDDKGSVTFEWQLKPSVHLEWDKFDPDTSYLNKELVLMVIARFKALLALEQKDYETFSYLEHITNLMYNMYNEQREHSLIAYTELKEPHNAF